MTEVLAFRPEHRLEIREVAAAVGCEAGPAIWEAVAAQGGSVTVRVDGRIVMCGGVVEHDSGAFEAWAAVDAEGRRHALAIHRVARRVLRAAVELCGQVLAIVVEDWPEANEWVRRLGFRRIDTANGLRPDGRTCAVYALGV